jgi:hypothetical protein
MQTDFTEYTKKGISLRVQRFGVEIQTQTETRSMSRDMRQKVKLVFLDCTICFFKKEVVSL